ncbi:hypothetical protein D3C84_480080 [compost metagenome]
MQGVPRVHLRQAQSGDHMFLAGMHRLDHLMSRAIVQADTGEMPIALLACSLPEAMAGNKGRYINGGCSLLRRRADHAPGTGVVLPGPISGFDGEGVPFTAPFTERDASVEDLLADLRRPRPHQFVQAQRPGVGVQVLSGRTRHFQVRHSGQCGTTVDLVVGQETFLPAEARRERLATGKLLFQQRVRPMLRRGNHRK